MKRGQAVFSAPLSQPLTGIEVRLVNHPVMPAPYGKHEEITEWPIPVNELVTDLAAGTAAEHLVCADLLLSGWRAFLADQNCPYDVAVDVGGRLIRIQVKSTRQQRAIPQRGSYTPAYLWHVRRAGKAGKRTYADGDFDLLALDIRLIAYMPPSEQRQTVHIRPPESRAGKQFADYPFKRAAAAVLSKPIQPVMFSL